MRVLLTAPRIPPDRGGVEEHVGQLASRLAEHDLTLDIVCGTHTHQPTVTVPSATVTRVRYPSSSTDRIPAALVKEIWSRAATAEVVWSHSYHHLSTYIAAAAARRHQVPFVVTGHYHGTGHSPFAVALHRLWRPTFGRQMLSSAAAVICVSGPEADLVAAQHPGLASRLHVIPNAPTPGPGRAAVQPMDTSVPVVLTVGRLVPYKGVGRLIDTARRAQGRWQLVVVGDGPYRASLTARAQGTNTIFTGHITNAELARWWATASAVASASYEEAFGLVIADALAAGIPTVTSDIPAHRFVATLADLPPDRCQLIPGDWDFLPAIDAAIRSGVRPGPTGLGTWDEAAEGVAALLHEVRR